MLVLIRQRDESIVITDRETQERITIRVVHVGDRKTRLGVSASPRYLINRDEVQRAIDAGVPAPPKPEAA